MSFDDEFEELAALAYRTAYRILGSRPQSQDVAQDTMVKAYVRWRQVDGHARAWVCRVAANGALGVVRRRSRHPATESPTATAGVEVADRLDLQRLLATLTRRQRDVVVLRYLADMSEADTASELGISVGTVKAHAHRALEILRRGRSQENHEHPEGTVVGNHCRTEGAL